MKLQRDCGEWTEVLQLPQLCPDTPPSNQTDYPWKYRDA
jgi:hypothetical protein